MHLYKSVHLYYLNLMGLRQIVFFFLKNIVSEHSPMSIVFHITAAYLHFCGCKCKINFHSKMGTYQRFIAKEKLIYINSKLSFHCEIIWFLS